MRTTVYSSSSPGPRSISSGYILGFTVSNAYLSPPHSTGCPKPRLRHQCFRTPWARGTAPASAMSLAPRWAPQQCKFWCKVRPSVRITSAPIMAATTAKAAASTLSSSAVSTAVPFLPTGSGDGVNITYRTTLTTVTVTTNETSINTTAFPEPMMESSGMGMVLIPFGIITVLGLAVAIVRKYLQINITNVGLSTVVLQISKVKTKHVCCHQAAKSHRNHCLNYNTSQTVVKQAHLY